jgi:hypothetical protein
MVLSLSHQFPKVLKYPEIEDYKQSIRELDEKEWINMRLCISDLRNNYAILVCLKSIPHFLF